MAILAFQKPDKVLKLETEGHIQKNDNNGKDSKSQHTVNYHELLVRI